MRELMRDSRRGFLGVNLRRDAVTTDDGAVERAINLDLHTTIGVATVRRGSVLQFANGLGGRVRLLIKIGGRRYQVAGQRLFRNQLAILSGLSQNLRTSLVPQKPLNDLIEWVFIADDSGMQKDRGDVVYQWGLDAPTVAPTLAAGGAGNLTGTYRACYTYVRKNGALVAAESNPSPNSDPLTVIDSEMLASGMPDSTDPQVTHKRVYRTVNGGSVLLFEDEIPQGQNSVTLSIPDTALSDAVERDNYRPPRAALAALHQESIFLAGNTAAPNTLYWSKRFRPESYPEDQTLEIGPPSIPITALVSLVGVLGVFTPTTKYRVVGNHLTGFTDQESLSSRGAAAPQATVVTERGCVFVARDGIFLTDFVQRDQELSQAIQPLFYGETRYGYEPINWAAASTMSLAYWQQRLYFAYPSGQRTSPDMLAVYSFHTGRWYFYTLRCTSLYVEEDRDVLTGGTLTGHVLELETGTQDNGQTIVAILRTAPGAMQDITRRKRFDYLYFDGELAQNALAQVFTDENLDRSLTIFAGARPQLPIRLPGKNTGFTWKVQLVLRGQATVYAIDAAGIPLEAFA